MPEGKSKRRVLVIGGGSLIEGQRTFWTRKDGGGITAPFGLRLPAGQAQNEKELIDKELAHYEDEE